MRLGAGFVDTASLQNGVVHELVGSGQRLYRLPTSDDGYWQGKPLPVAT